MMPVMLSAHRPLRYVVIGRPLTSFVRHGLSLLLGLAVMICLTTVSQQSPQTLPHPPSCFGQRTMREPSARRSWMDVLGWPSSTPSQGCPPAVAGGAIAAAAAPMLPLPEGPSASPPAHAAYRQCQSRRPGIRCNFKFKYIGSVSQHSVLPGLEVSWSFAATTCHAAACLCFSPVAFGRQGLTKHGR